MILLISSDTFLMLPIWKQNKIYHPWKLYFTLAYFSTTTTSIELFSQCLTASATYTNSARADILFFFISRVWFSVTNPQQWILHAAKSWRQTKLLLKAFEALKRAVLDWDVQWTYLELVYLVTAFVPSLTACFASSPGKSSRTAVWISRLVIVDLLL